MKNYLKLVFAGRVFHVRPTSGKHCFKIGSVGDVDLFVVGDDHLSVGALAISPAWMVPVVKKKGKPGGQVPKAAAKPPAISATMQYVHYVCKMQWNPRGLALVCDQDNDIPEAMKCVVSIPYLVPKDESGTEGLATISRPQLSQELEIQQQKNDVTSYGPQMFAAQAKSALDVQGQPRQVATPVRAAASAKYKHVTT